MKKMIFALVFISYALTCMAEESVYLPCKKLTNKVDKIVIEDKFYDSYSGYDFTGKGRPRYYDPMYSTYFNDYPPYSRMNAYPTFFMQPIRSRNSKK